MVINAGDFLTCLLNIFRDQGMKFFPLNFYKLVPSVSFSDLLILEGFVKSFLLQISASLLYYSRGFIIYSSRV